MDSAAIERALESAARRGVDVRVTMTAQSSWVSAFTQLTAAGVHVHLYASNASLYIHAKMILTPGRVLLGSRTSRRFDEPEPRARSDHHGEGNPHRAAAHVRPRLRRGQAVCRRLERPYSVTAILQTRTTRSAPRRTPGRELQSAEMIDRQRSRCPPLLRMPRLARNPGQPVTRGGSRRGFSSGLCFALIPGAVSPRQGGARGAKASVPCRHRPASAEGSARCSGGRLRQEGGFGAAHRREFACRADVEAS